MNQETYGIFRNNPNAQFMTQELNRYLAQAPEAPDPLELASQRYSAAQRAQSRAENLSGMLVRQDRLEQAGGMDALSVSQRNLLQQQIKKAEEGYYKARGKDARSFAGIDPYEQRNKIRQERLTAPQMPDISGFIGGAGGVCACGGGGEGSYPGEIMMRMPPMPGRVDEQGEEVELSRGEMEELYERREKYEAELDRILSDPDVSIYDLIEPKYRSGPEEEAREIWIQREREKDDADQAVQIVKAYESLDQRVIQFQNEIDRLRETRNAQNYQHVDLALNRLQMELEDTIIRRVQLNDEYQKAMPPPVNFFYG